MDTTWVGVREGGAFASWDTKSNNNDLGCDPLPRAASSDDSLFRLHSGLESVGRTKYGASNPGAVLGESVSGSQHPY